MNFLSHAFRFQDDPLFALGTQIPDLMNVVDRKARPRKKLAQFHTESPDALTRNLALGIIQHHIDDHDFHSSVLFHQLNSKLSNQFRQWCPDEKGMRSWFAAHIIIEMLLDVAIAEWLPGSRETLYKTFKNHCGKDVGKAIEAIVGKPLPKFEKMYGMFIEQKFLYDYDTDQGLMFRINQVIKRVGLEPFECTDLRCIEYSRTLVFDNWKPLLESLSNPPVDWGT